MSKLLDKLKPFKKPPTMTGYVYNAWEHTSWGNNIEFEGTDAETGLRRIVGWLPRKPEVGDEIRFKMQSGKVSRMRVQGVEHTSNVRDMFFADLMDIGYVGGPPINKVREAAQS